ncbi:MAG TPA: metallophosphoesterase, partial [Phycisphaerae bacterium]|nr:metallophosphoesterase [Phycisphaerae bacterium]
MDQPRNTRRRSIWLAAIILTALGGLGILTTVILSDLRITGRPAAFVRGPYLQNVTTAGATIRWDTDRPFEAAVRLFDERGLRVRDLAVPASGPRHEVRLDGLQPNTRYRYVIDPPGWSSEPAEGTFVTSPPPGTDCEFAIWGDSRSDPETCRAVADAIRRSGVPMCVHSGDFVYHGYNRDEWDSMFFQPAAALLRDVMLWPALGNHELGADLNGVTGRQVFSDFFSLPGSGQYYSFDYGDAHILVLDSNYDFFEDPGQYEFADKNLAATRARWKIVVFHHPVFTSGETHDNHFGMRLKYCPLFARHSVDLIFTGHDHNYQRSRPIVHRHEPAQKHPYLHIVSGGGGAPKYEVQRARDLWFDKAEVVNHYAHLRVEGDKLTLQAIDLEGRVIDTCVLDR